MNRELAEMLSWVCRLQGATTADLLEILLRPQVEKRYSENFNTINILKNHEDATALESGKPTGPPLPKPREFPAHGFDQVNADILTMQELIGPPNLDIAERINRYSCLTEEQKRQADLAIARHTVHLHKMATDLGVFDDAVDGHLSSIVGKIVGRFPPVQEPSVDMSRGLKKKPKKPKK